MSVISKAQLKNDFLDGKTITEQKMDDLIDSTYNSAGQILITGCWQNVFDGASGTYDYMSWNQNTTGSTSIPVLTLPFNCKLLTYTTRFVGAGTSGPVIWTPGDIFTQDIGTIPNGLEPVEANWTSSTDETVGAVTPGGGIQVWDDTSGDYPGMTSTGLDIDFNAGDGIAVIALETGTILPTGAGEIITSFLFQLT